MININSQFQIYEYEDNLKAKLEIYQLQGKDTLWWEEIKMEWGVDEQEVSWDNF